MKRITLLFVVICFLAPCLAQQTESISNDDKRKFVILLKSLKTKGEFFTDESIEKTIPYQNILFAFTEKDLSGQDIYPYLAISSGMMEYQQCREYARKNFSSIQHPDLKIGWAAMLLKQNIASPEIITYLSQVLKIPVQKKLLQEMCGPKFDEVERKIQAESRKLK